MVIISQKFGDDHYYGYMKFFQDCLQYVLSGPFTRDAGCATLQGNEDGYQKAQKV